MGTIILILCIAGIVAVILFGIVVDTNEHADRESQRQLMREIRARDPREPYTGAPRKDRDGNPVSKPTTTTERNHHGKCR